MAAFSVSIPESCFHIVCVYFYAVSLAVPVEVFCVCNIYAIDVSNINMLRQFEVETFSHGPCAGERFLCCYFQRPVVAVVCNTIVVNVNAAVDYRNILVFIYGKDYFVIHNLHDFNCCCSFERIRYRCAQIAVLVCYNFIQSLDCHCACSAGLSGCGFDFDIFRIDCEGILINCGCAVELYISCIFFHKEIVKAFAVSNAEFALIEFKALGQLQFEPLIVSEVANCGTNLDIAFQIHVFFFSDAANFSCCSCDASAFNRNINQIITVYCVGVNRNCCALTSVCLVQLGAKVNDNDIIHCKSACESICYLILVILLYRPCDAIDRGSTVARTLDCLVAQFQSSCGSFSCCISNHNSYFLSCSHIKCCISQICSVYIFSCSRCTCTIIYGNIKFA